MRQLLIFLLGWTAALSALDFGEDAPNFILSDQEGFSHSLRDHRGRFVLLFFYPRDFTHCGIKEVRSFEQYYKTLNDLEVTIYGVSNDFTKTHHAFHEKFKLTYDLLSDPDKNMIREYDAESWFGTKIISYLIGPDGRVFRKYENKNSSEIAALVLQDLQ